MAKTAGIRDRDWVERDPEGVDWTPSQRARWDGQRKRIHSGLIHASGGQGWGRDLYRIHRINSKGCGAWSEGLKDLPSEPAAQKQIRDHAHVPSPERVTKRCKTPAEFKAGKKSRRLPVKQEILGIY